MLALTFNHVPATGYWLGYQPDGEQVGVVRRSRKNDPRYAFEALILGRHIVESGVRHTHCGYGDTPDAAKWMLVCGLAFRMGGAT